MASITQTVKWNGTGDYSNLVTGINGILASGVDPTYTVFKLIVDSGYYYGVFNAVVPNSGTLTIAGSGTWFAPNNVCYISGEYAGNNNFVMTDVHLVGTGISSNALSIAGGTHCELDNIYYFGGSSGIINSGILTINNTNAMGNGSGYFISSPAGIVNMIGNSIVNFGTAVSGISISCFENRLLDNKIGVCISGTVNATKSLITGTSGIVLVSGSTINGDHLTVDTLYQCFVGSNSYININTSIIGSANGYSITGISVSGQVSDCCFNPSGWDPALTLISGVNSSGNPLYNNTLIHDYRLQLLDTVGSPCIEVIDPGIVDSTVVLKTDQSQLSLSNINSNDPDPKKYRSFPVDPAIYRPFIYKQGNTLLFSDYEKEASFAETNALYPITNYDLYTEALFSVSGVTVTAAMDDSSSPFPYDWDFRIFDTPEIIINYSMMPGNNMNDYEYIIPRSILDVAMTISPYIGNWINNVAFSQIKIPNITPYMYNDYRGVTYDYDATSPEHTVIWSIEGRNQMLTKMDAFTGDVLGTYPLFISNPTHKYIYPAGLIGAGVFQNKYKYLKTSNPNEVFYSSASNSGFQWLSTQIDTLKDARGLMAYKGNIYLTISEYSGPIVDRSYIPVLPENSGTGAVIRYNNNHIFNHYLANYNSAEPMDNAPVRMPLFSGNAYPTDITMYEDGTFFVADYLNSSGIYRYRFAYDYALIQSSYDRDSTVLLRENYDDVQL